jgi:hypothetical protein
MTISGDDFEIDDFEMCVECRNVDITKDGTVICLGSRRYREMRHCLDIEIDWRELK